MHTPNQTTTSVSFGGGKSRTYGDSRFADSRYMDSRFAGTGSLSMGKPQKARKSTLVITCLALIVTACFIVLAFLLKSSGKPQGSASHHDAACSTQCEFQMAETLPEVLQYPSGSIQLPKISDNLMRMIARANVSIDIASSYWTLKSEDVEGGPYAEAAVGEALLDALHHAAQQRGIQVRIVQQVLRGSSIQNDTQWLSKLPTVEVRTLNMTQFFGSGITHTKMWIVDKSLVYVGSANTDWRSLSVVKELGIVVDNCACVGIDAAKIFDVFWMLAKPGQKIPKQWPADVQTDYNKDHPMVAVDAKNISTVLFLAASPGPLCPPQRTADIDGLLQVIASARHFVHVAVMDYATATLYMTNNRYWSIIDSALRSAAYDRNVSVRILASHWTHSRREQTLFLKSIQALNGAGKGSIEVRQFTFPPCQNIPYSCVNHNKYMVTDNAAYIGTSNWSGDYFIDTTGVSVVVNSTSSQHLNSVVRQTQQVFDRDWSSTYAKPL